MVEKGMASPIPASRPISPTAIVTLLTLTGLIWAGWAALITALPTGVLSAAALWAAICRPLPSSAGFWDSYAASLAVWLPMVPAMMLPSAIPMAFAFAARIERQGGALKPVLLIGAYLGIWLVAASLFAFVQTLGADALNALKLPERAVGILGGFAIGLAGLWQFAPIKRLSLAACRHDFSDVPERPNLVRTLKLGAEQGIACILCCWVLMLAAAAVGAMNLLWMAALAAVMTAEKMIGPRATAPLGLVLLSLGTIIAINAVGAGRLLAYWLG